MVSMKIPFHLLEAILQTGISKPKLAVLLVTWTKSLLGFLRVRYLEPLFFNISINDLFLFANKSEISNYANDNTVYCANKNINQIISNLSNDFETLRKWFYDNYMVLNPDQCHFMTLGFQDQNFDFHCKNVVIRNSAEKKKYLELP